ncbi:MAG: efflux RND transporter periplasmic adaptor subunit [Verrucomicrobiota bacterium]|jgi:HlyD family secretion protein
MAENHSHRWVKWAVILGAAIVVIGGGIWYFRRGHNNAPVYQTAAVTRGDLTQVVTATGTLNPVTNVTVGSQISGIIQTLYVDWNSPVKANQVVAQLDPATYKAAVAQAEGDLANSKANLELNEVQAKRATELFKDNLIAESDYDTAMANLHQAQAMVQIKQASLDNAKVNLSRCTIYSPVDGTIISRNVDVGQTVAASLSAPTLFIIANDLTQMQIDANVSEADIGSVEERQAVTFTVDAFPDRKFTGRVMQIRNSPTTVQNVVTYDTVIEVSNPDLKLRPGMTANASIITAQRSGVLKIPNAALRFRLLEPSTNKTFAARLLAKIGLGKETKPAATNIVQVAKSGDTNKTEVAANTRAPLTGNEPPEELMRRVREMRDRGEEVPPEIRAKLRELYQSGALQRPSGGSGDFGARGGGGSGSRGAQPASRTIYVLATNAPSGEPTPQAVRVKTGISDGAYTEISNGLKEGDVVITAVKLPQSQVATSSAGASPFGGGGRGGGR